MKCCGEVISIAVSCCECCAVAAKYRVLPCVVLCSAVCCSVLQCAAVCCLVLCCCVFNTFALWGKISSAAQRVAACCSVLQCVAMCCSVLQRVVACCSVLQCVAMYCSDLHRCVVRSELLRVTQMRCLKSSIASLSPLWSSKSHITLSMQCFAAVAVCCSVLQHAAMCYVIVLFEAVRWALLHFHRVV